MKSTIYTQRTKNAFIKKHNLANLLPELDLAIQFDIQQLLHRNSAEVNKTLRIAALRSETDRLTELGQQVLHYLLAAVDGIDWDNGRIALGKIDVKLKSEVEFTAYIAQAKAKAKAKAEADAEAKAAKAAEAKAKAEADAEAKAAKAAEAKAKAEANKSDELAQVEAAAAAFDAKSANSKLVAGDKNISVKAAQSLLHGLIAGNLNANNLQDLNDTIKLLNLAQQALARQATKVTAVQVDETRVDELSKTKATGKEKTANKTAA